MFSEIARTAYILPQPSDKTQMSDIKFNCPHCQQRLGVSETLLGRKIPCPVCGGHIRLPDMPSSPVLTPAIPVEKPKTLGTTVPIAIKNGDITFFCPQCKTKLVISERAAGKQISCRGCGSPITVPSSTMPPDPIGRETINLTLNQPGLPLIGDLIKKIREGDEQAVRLVLMRGASAIPALLEGLEENSLEDPKTNPESDRVAAVLVKFGWQSVPALISKLGKSRRAYFALGRIANEESINALVRELTSVNWRRVEVACIALGLAEDPAALRAVPHLETTRKTTRVGEVFSAAGTALAALQRRYQPRS